MKRLRKLLALILVGIMAITTLGGCGGKKADLKIMILVGPELDAFYKDYFKTQEEKYGIEIEYLGYAWQDYHQQLKAEMSSGAGPDIFYINPGDVKKFVKNGTLHDMNGYLNSEEGKQQVDLSILYKTAIDAYRFDGTTVGTDNESAPLYGINLGSSYQGMAYNVKLVDRKKDIIKSTKVTSEGVGERTLVMPYELGVDGNYASYTFEEFAKICEICADTTGGGMDESDKVYGCSIPMNIRPFIWNRGGEIVNEDKTQVTFNTPEVKYALNYIKNLKDTNVMHVDATWPAWTNNQVAFFTQAGSWEVPSYEMVDGFNYDFMPYPSLKGDEVWYGEIGTSALAVNNKSANLNMAEKVAASFFTEELLDQFIKQQFALPMVKEIAENAYLQDDETYKPANRKLFIDVISGKNGKFSIINSTLTTEWYDIMSDDLDKVWNNTQTIDEFAAEKEAAMQQLYNESIK